MDTASAWFFLGASGLYLLQFNGDCCERDLFYLDHWIIWNAENIGSAFEYEYVGLHIRL